MSNPADTFVSSLDVLSSDDDANTDDDDNARSSSPAASTSDPSRSNSPEVVAAPPAAASTIKGRNTAPIVRQPSGRASKVQAMAAMTAQSLEKAERKAERKAARAASASMASPAPGGAELHRDPPRKAVKMPKAPPLDWSTLRTSAPRLPNPPPRPASRPTRLFGLEHAPVYHPTVDEFASPMDYIESIAEEAKQYGICKIVPPEGWRPPFAVNTETFSFKTRLQQLNSMEASARASLNFLEQLYIFHRQQGSSGIAVPTVANKPLDLWRLRHEINALGGYAEVTNGRKWTTVAKKMGYAVGTGSAVCSQIKTAYLKIVVPFDDYVKRVKLNGGTPPPDPTILNDDVPILPDLANKINAATPKRTDGSETLATPVSEVHGRPAQGRMAGDTTSEKVRTASDKLNEALNSDGSKKNPVTKLAGLLPSKTLKAPVNDIPGEVCEICTFDHDPDAIVLCDGCDRGYHLNCLTPPLAEVPTSEFFCDTCLLLNGADYGFEEGEDHSLHSFRKRADAFKRRWMYDHPMPPVKGKAREGEAQTAEEWMNEQLLVEDHFEREFWRLVESPTESVEVEYGADVNCTADGGGFPNFEAHPYDPYSRDGWNLNNLPILAGSLLRYIKSDISGMTIPWIYVGMVFSTFAWHKEDHYTYSINYHHFGDTKTWYGIPGTDDEKLEAAMKLAAPELFDQQPDLMFQLVTLMSPGRLKKHGVRVVACDQRPNEFIITFPRAYHSGFNHGFNFNEAVNFALPDWLPIGLSCVKRYRDIKKNPVFSHDELLVTISQHEKDPRCARWILPSWREMVDRELASREKFRRLCPNTPEDVDDTEIDEELFQCHHCKVLSYHSQVISKYSDEIACLDHFSTLPDGPKSLRLRYDDDELQHLLAKVKSRSDKAGRGLASNPSEQQRTTGRKRKPSLAALEALEAAAEEPVRQRIKSESDSEDGYEEDKEDEEDSDDVMDADAVERTLLSRSNSATSFLPSPYPADPWSAPSSSRLAAALRAHPGLPESSWTSFNDLA